MILFTATLPLEAKKLLFALAASGQQEWRRGAWRRQKLMFIDVGDRGRGARVRQDACGVLRSWNAREVEAVVVLDAAGGQHMGGGLHGEATAVRHAEV